MDKVREVMENANDISEAIAQPMGVDDLLTVRMRATISFCPPPFPGLCRCCGSVTWNRQSMITSFYQPAFSYSRKTRYASGSTPVNSCPNGARSVVVEHTASCFDVSVEHSDHYLRPVLGRVSWRGRPFVLPRGVLVCAR